MRSHRPPPGPALASGHVRVDAGRAIAKLRAYRLSDPVHWILEAIRAAVATGATRIDLAGDADDLWLRWAGPPWPAESLPALFDDLVSPEPAHGGYPRRLLANAINSGLGLDPVEARRINLIPKFLEPHTTAIGQTYDVGDYETALDKALAAAGYDELRAEQARRRAAGDVVQLGIGVSTYVEITGGVEPFGEHAKIVVLDNGRANVYTGTSPHGQGHVTSWSMLAHEQTGIPMDQIDVIWGDTDLVPEGAGTMGSRSLQHGGTAVWNAAIELVEKARKLAAKLMEADEADVVLDKDSGSFHVSGTPSITKSWADLAVAAHTDEELPEGLQHALFFQGAASFPFGSHVAVVEVDTDTGKVRLVRQVACDDAGKVLNPMLLEGQIHGGIAQGAAQALMEEVRYDSDGNPVTSNLADYAFISAAELPSFEVVHMETPTHLNPLGAKGIGESGTIGSTPAVQSAVIDAVSHLGVRHIDMPCTAEKVWRAINAVTS